MTTRVTSIPVTESAFAFRNRRKNAIRSSSRYFSLFTTVSVNVRCGRIVLIAWKNLPRIWSRT